MTLRGLYQFDQFEVDPAKRQMRRAGEPVAVPQKVFQLLLVLLENPGRVLSKRELMDAVWTQAFVDEANLTQSIFLLRKALGEQQGRNKYIVTVPGEGYLFAVQPVIREQTSPLWIQSAEPPVEAGLQTQIAGDGPDSETRPTAIPSATDRSLSSSGGPVQNQRSMRMALLIAVPVLLAVAVGAVWYVAQRRGLKVNGSVVLADFANSTGDAAFDNALREGLASQLEQSPDLGVVSDARIAQTMKMMEQPKEARLNADLARQVCERTGSAAMVEGSISNLGHQYVLGLKAQDCQNGDTLAQDQETADGKEQVLQALGIAAGKLRRKLGASLPSLQKYDVPPEDVTTGSLEALKAYSLGLQAQGRGDCVMAIAHYKQAVTYDPSFAMAYARRGVCDGSEEGVNATRKAYALRDRVSDREKFYIDSHFEQYATGNLAAARKILETWAATYPHDGDPGPNLLKLYLTTGEYERALPLVQSVVKNSPSTPANNAMRMATTLLYLNRVDEAKAILLDAEAHHNDTPVQHYYLYEIDFLQNDSAGMAKEASYVRAQPGWAGNMLELESLSASYFGKFTLARSLSDQAAQDSLRDQDQNGAGGTLAEAALQEALAGNYAVAKKKASASIAYSKSSTVLTLAGMAQALSGDQVGAAQTIEQINRSSSTDTMSQAAVATMRAALLLGNGRSPDQARRAIEALGPASPYGLSSGLYLVPIYVRAQAYLASGQSANAAADFQTILDHSGVTRNFIIGPVARLGLAQAEQQAGDTAKARAAYLEFLHWWRDADADLAMLKAARISLSQLSH